MLCSGVRLVARLVVSHDDVAQVSVSATITKSTATAIDPDLTYCLAIRSLIGSAQAWHLAVFTLADAFGWSALDGRRTFCVLLLVAL
eukprot:997069-Karenia_brevis.AAC.1